MRPIMILPGRRLGRRLLGLLLIVACVAVAAQPSAIHAMSPESLLDATPGSLMQPPDSARIPTPARNYALDVTAIVSLPGFGSDVHEVPGDPPSGDGSAYQNQFQTSAPEPDTVTVESTVYVLGSNDLANQKFEGLLKPKRDDLRAQTKREPSVPADRVVSYQTPAGVPYITVGALIRQRNAVALVEIRGRSQQVTTENAKALVSKMLEALKRAGQPAEAAAR